MPCRAKAYPTSATPCAGLADSATYLYRDGTRYWYSTQPTVANLAADRADELRRDPHKVEREIEKRMRENFREKSEFRRVHLFPESGQDVQDDMEVGLVVLNVRATHTSGAEDSPALHAAKDILESRGSAPRLFRNALLFLAADQARHQDLDQAVRIYLAWRSILDDRDALDLPPHQVRQTQQQSESAGGTVNARIGESFPWLLVPSQKTPQAPVEWQKSVCADQAPWRNRPAAACSTTKCSLLPWPGPGSAWSWTACRCGAALMSPSASSSTTSPATSIFRACSNHPSFSTPSGMAYRY